MDGTEHLETARDAGDGNTNSITSPANKQGMQHKYWAFTFNNYEKEHLEIIFEGLKNFRKIDKFIFQEECGENGTRHLQGHVELKSRARWSEFKLPKEIHWEPVRNLEASRNYCQKEKTRAGKIFFFGFSKPIKIIEKLFPWQEQIVKICESEPDERTVHWIFSEDGCKGKTSLTKYLAVTKKALCCSSGKSNDIINFIFKSDLDESNIVIFDLARIAKDNISYEALEKIKDGMIFNTKYETGSKIFNAPHVFVFANGLPKVENLSIDRWKIYEIDASDSLIPVDPAEIRGCELSPEFSGDNDGEQAIASQFA